MAFCIRESVLTFAFKKLLDYKTIVLFSLLVDSLERINVCVQVEGFLRCFFSCCKRLFGSICALHVIAVGGKKPQKFLKAANPTSELAFEIRRQCQ